MAGAEMRENEASMLRSRLADLASMEAPPAELAKVLKEELRQIDAGLSAMEEDLFRRFDAIDFVALRASIPRAVERNRREVIALLEALLCDRENLQERLPRVEYLITILSTEEVDGRRNIVHDPTALTPMIEEFASEIPDSAEADTVAMELYQAATLDSDSENFENVLQSIRARKRKIGIGCLAPSVMRAVVTYNARMYNSVESMTDASRASDAIVDDALLALTELEEGEDVFDDLDSEMSVEDPGAVLDSSVPTAVERVVEPAAERDIETTLEPAAEPGAPAKPTLATLLGDTLDAPLSLDGETPGDDDLDFASELDDAPWATVPEPVSEATPASNESSTAPESPVDSASVPEVAVERATVFQSKAIGSILKALRARLAGEQVGRRGSAERIAIVLDQGSLEEIEIDAIRAEMPSREESLIGRTAVVGLILRDLGPIESEIRKIGIDRSQLTDEWVRALSEDLGQLISAKLGDSNAYDRASQLSKIKSKHLLKPMNSLKAAERSEAGDQTDGFFSGLEAGKSTRSAGESRASQEKRAKSRTRSKASAKKGEASSAGITLGASRFKVIAAAALVSIALGLTAANMIDVAPTDIRILKGGALSDSSPYIKSAYRNQSGRGALLIGRVDSEYILLPLEGRIEEANQMAKNFEEQGIREAMLYDDRGLMHVHYAAGVIHRPRPIAVRQERTRPIRRGLMGAVVESASEEEDDWDESGWGEDDDEE